MSDTTEPQRTLLMGERQTEDGAGNAKQLPVALSATGSQMVHRANAWPEFPGWQTLIPGESIVLDVTGTPATEPDYHVSGRNFKGAEISAYRKRGSHVASTPATIADAVPSIYNCRIIDAIVICNRHSSAIVIDISVQGNSATTYILDDYSIPAKTAIVITPAGIQIIKNYPTLVDSGGTGLSSVAVGALLYGNGTNPLQVLPIGTAAQILQVNAGANAPVWNSVSGDFTLSSSGVGAIGANKILDSMFRQSLACAIPLRSANSTGNIADLQISEGQVPVRRSNAIASGYATRGLYKVVGDSPYTVSALDAGATLICNAVGGAMTITLPTITAALDGMPVTILLVSGSGNTVTINRGGSNVIGPSATSNVLTGQNAYVTLIADNTNGAWWVQEANDYLRANNSAGMALSTSATWTNITSCSIDLKPGEWDLSGIVLFGVGTAVASSNWMGAISSGSGTTTSDHVVGDNQNYCVPATSVSNSNVAIPAFRVSVTTSTTYYLKANIGISSGSANVFGRISARRVG